MSYEPAPVPMDVANLGEYLARELRRLAQATRDNAPSVFYRTLSANQGSLSAAVSANYKIASGNVVRVSASATVTLTGLAGISPGRELVLVNVGHGVVFLKSEGTESSASFRFALATNWELSQNAAATLWYDSASARWRGLSRT